LAPPKGCATHNGKKLQFLFLFFRFLSKNKDLVQTLQALEGFFQSFLLRVFAFNFDANCTEPEEISNRVLLQVEREVS
jgi:hypothetical protein